MINQFTLLPSDAFVLLMTNEVLLVIVPTDKDPTFVKLPVVASVRKITLAVFTAEVFTVTVPPESVAVPIVAFVPVGIFNPDPTLVIAKSPLSCIAAFVPVVYFWPFTKMYPAGATCSLITLLLNSLTGDELAVPIANPLYVLEG